MSNLLPGPSASSSLVHNIFWVKSCLGHFLSCNLVIVMCAVLPKHIASFEGNVYNVKHFCFFFRPMHSSPCFLLLGRKLLTVSLRKLGTCLKESLIFLTRSPRFLVFFSLSPRKSEELVLEGSYRNFILVFCWRTKNLLLRELLIWKFVLVNSSFWILHAGSWKRLLFQATTSIYLLQQTS